MTTKQDDMSALRAVFTNEVIRAIGALARQQNVFREQGGQVVFVTGMEAAREYIVESIRAALTEAAPPEKEQNPDMVFLREAVEEAAKDAKYFQARADHLEGFICDHRCSECRHQFSADEIASEDPLAWGHPCHAKTTQPVSACESYREPMDTIEEG